jgi:hypothetical protein
MYHQQRAPHCRFYALQQEQVQQGEQPQQQPAAFSLRQGGSASEEGHD